MLLEGLEKGLLGLEAFENPLRGIFEAFERHKSLIQGLKRLYQAFETPLKTF